MRKVIAIFLLVLGIAELVQFFIDFDPDRQIPQYVWSLLYPAILIAAGYQLWFVNKTKKTSRPRNTQGRRPQNRSQGNRNRNRPRRSPSMPKAESSDKESAQ